MDEAFVLADFLPLSFKTRSEQEYIAFLWDSFETNYMHEKYQFAFLAYHMLSMSFVYFNIWQIKQSTPADFEKAAIGFTQHEKALLDATTPFSLYSISGPAVAGLESLAEAEVGVILLEVRPRPKDCRLGSARGLGSAGCSLAAHNPQG